LLALSNKPPGKHSFELQPPTQTSSFLLCCGTSGTVPIKSLPDNKRYQALSTQQLRARAVDEKLTPDGPAHITILLYPHASYYANYLYVVRGPMIKIIKDDLSYKLYCI